ncbi:hypothetical protein KAJ89_06100 [Candidatus Parcubacteria bacterium]|nr:hypothetical protein [Candidatus Parcubacteria bacterium]
MQEFPQPKEINNKELAPNDNESVLEDKIENEGTVDVAIDLIIKKRGGEKAFPKEYKEAKNYVLNEIRVALSPDVVEKGKVDELYDMLDKKIRKRFPELGLQEAA